MTGLIAHLVNMYALLHLIITPCALLQGYASPDLDPQEHTPLLPGSFDYLDDSVDPPSFLQCW